MKIVLSQYQENIFLALEIISMGLRQLYGGHSIAPKTTSAIPQPPNEQSRKRQSSYRLGQVRLV